MKPHHVAGRPLWRCAKVAGPCDRCRRRIPLGGLYWGIPHGFHLCPDCGPVPPVLRPPAAGPACHGAPA